VSPPTLLTLITSHFYQSWRSLTYFCSLCNSYHCITTTMPIVGPVSTIGTNTLGTALSCFEIAESFVLSGERWWHSTIFVTSPSVFNSGGAPDLTTFYTYPTQCVDRWMMGPSNCQFESYTVSPHNVTVFSIDPSKGTVSDPLYKSCQRYSTPTYTPGVCPSGHTIAEVTAYQSSVPTGFVTFWEASCCRRFSTPCGIVRYKAEHANHTMTVG
jgi:hypothetical protein